MRNGRLFARGNTFSLVNKFYKTVSRSVCLSVCLAVRISVGRPLRANQFKRKDVLKNRSDSQMKHIHNVTLQKTANFSVYNIVADLRRQRMAMVQTKVLCYQSLFFPVMIYCVDQGPGRDLSSG